MLPYFISLTVHLYKKYHINLRSYGVCITVPCSLIFDIYCAGKGVGATSVPFLTHVFAKFVSVVMAREIGADVFYLFYLMLSYCCS